MSLNIPWLSFAEKLKAQKVSETPESIELALKVCSEWRSGTNLIPAFLWDIQKPVGEINTIKSYRLAVLNIATLSALESWMETNSSKSQSEDWILELITMIMCDDVQCLQLSQDTQPEISMRLKEKVAIAITKLRKKPYGFEFPLDLENANSWQDLWSNVTATIVLLWLQRDTKGKISELRKRFLFSQSLPSFTTNLMTSIPTAFGFGFNLKCCEPWLAQTLQHDCKQGWASCDREFHTRRFGDMASGSGTNYYGLQSGHISLAVLITHLHHQSLTNQIFSTDQAPMTTPHPTGLPTELVDILPCGQWDCVDMAINPIISFETYFAPADSNNLSVMAPLESGRTIEPTPPFNLDQSFLHFQINTNDDELSLGSIAIDPADLSPDASLFWIDIVVVVKKNDIWQLLPIFFEESEGGANRIELVISTVPLYSALIEQLRQRLPSASWACQVDSFGAMVACAINLDFQTGGV